MDYSELERGELMERFIKVLKTDPLESITQWYEEYEKERLKNTSSNKNLPKQP